MSSDYERRLCAHLTEAAVIAECYDIGLRGEHFEEPLYQAIWNFSVAYWLNTQRQSAPTAWILGQEFSGYTLPTERAEEPGYLADKLIVRAVTNRVQTMVRKAADVASDNPRLALKDLAAEAFAATEISAPRRTRINMADTIEARRDRYRRRREAPQGLGVPYGLELLDTHTGGILPGELAVVGAFAKTGKTMFLLNAAAHAVVRGHKPAVFSLELSLDDTQDRLDAMFSGVSYDQLSRGTLTVEREQSLHESQDLLASLGGVVVERPEEGERTVGQLVSRVRQLGCDYLIIDQLSKLEAGHKTSSKKEEYGSILRQLKNSISRAGKELPCLLAVQLRREKEEPSIQSFADAAEVERDCDLALTLWRSLDLYRNHQMKLEVVATRRSDVISMLLEWELTAGTRIRAIEPIGR